ncbi:MAG: ParA family protein [Candidatus Magnetoovum sp. WYHC-5]|nr:ParA family protein [Candidatus Magnetoovum sp. WYHC-5]
MSRLVTFANRKGGCGKTTTAVNVAHALAINGYNVLFIDVDPQAHSTMVFGFQSHLLEVSLFDVLTKSIEIEKAILQTRIDKLFLIPSARNLTVFEMEYSSQGDSEIILRTLVSQIENNYDFIIFDTPPTLNLLLLSTLIATEQVFIPVQLHFLAMEGLAEMVNVISKIRDSYNPRLYLAGIIPTFYDKNRFDLNLNNEIKQIFGKTKILNYISFNYALHESPAYGQSIFEYAPRSKGAYDYMKLANLIEIT